MLVVPTIVEPVIFVKTPVAPVIVTPLKRPETVTPVPKVAAPLTARVPVTVAFPET